MHINGVNLHEQGFSTSIMLKLSTLKPSTTLTLNSEATNIIKLPGLENPRGKNYCRYISVDESRYFLVNYLCY